MISIIICSINDDLFAKVSSSIQDTIGVPYEIIRVENKDNKFSICSAYNHGAGKANYDILCFTHEDIVFEATGWGRSVVRVFEDPGVGLIGNIGATYLSLFPVGWVDRNELEGRVNYEALPGSPIHQYNRFGTGEVAEVVAVDGMLMITRRSIWKEFPFSEKLLKGFHGYDLDFSLQVGRKYRIVVLRTLLISHLSGGSYNENYYETIRTLFEKWKDDLPVYINKYTRQEIAALHIKSLLEFSKSPAFSEKEAIVIAKKRGILLPWLFKRLGSMIGFSK